MYHTKNEVNLTFFNIDSNKYQILGNFKWQLSHKCFCQVMSKRLTYSEHYTQDKIEVNSIQTNSFYIRILFQQRYWTHKQIKSYLVKNRLRESVKRG